MFLQLLTEEFFLSFMREEKGKACSVEDSACHLLKFLKKVFEGKCGKFIITS